jgi:hypothetical protein
MEALIIPLDYLCRRLRPRWCLFLVACFLTSLTGAVGAQSSGNVELQIKAAYLLKFGNYVEWPSESFDSGDKSFRIGIIGADELADELAKMVIGRSVNGRPITIRKLRATESTSDMHLLYIGYPSGTRLTDLLAQLQGRSILVVTDSQEALAYGSMINFVVVDGRLRFEVAPKNAARGKIDISARLLATAYKVRAEPS